MCLSSSLQKKLTQLWILNCKLLVDALMNICLRRYFSQQAFSGHFWENEEIQFEDREYGPLARYVPICAPTSIIHPYSNIQYHIYPNDLKMIAGVCWAPNWSMLRVPQPNKICICTLRRCLVARIYWYGQDRLITFKAFCSNVGYLQCSWFPNR